ncbi:MAG: O-antigen ligase family protein [Nostoc sp. TH1S01]|nr:O-antigen ligase family protein [Nostoc sp. TH1S01]
MNNQNLVIPKKVELVLVVCLLVLIEVSKLPRFGQQIISLFYYVIPFIVMINRWNRFTYVIFQDIFLLLLTLLAITSVLWSENPSWTLQASLFLVRCTIFGVYLGMTYTPKELLGLLSLVFFLLIVISLFVGLLFPSYNLQLFYDGSLAWSGVFGHKQSFGPYMGLAALTYLINCFDQRINRLFALCVLSMALVLIILSKSATSLIIFCVALNLMLLYKVIKQKSFRGILLIIILSIYASLFFNVVSNLEIIVELLNKDIEFNGRTPIWTLAIESALKRPWLGYGYQGFWSSEVSAQEVSAYTWISRTESYLNGENGFHAHNGYIDLFLDLGVLGLSLFVINIFNLLKRIIYLSFINRRIENFWYFQFVVFFLVNILANGRGILWYRTDWVIYIAICFSSALEYRKIQKDKHYKKLSF